MNEAGNITQAFDFADDPFIEATGSVQSMVKVERQMGRAAA